MATLRASSDHVAQQNEIAFNFAVTLEIWRHIMRIYVKRHTQAILWCPNDQLVSSEFRKCMTHVFQNLRIATSERTPKKGTVTGRIKTQRSTERTTVRRQCRKRFKTAKRLLQNLGSDPVIHDNGIRISWLQNGLQALQPLQCRRACRKGGSMNYEAFDLQLTQQVLGKCQQQMQAAMPRVRGLRVL